MMQELVGPRPCLTPRTFRLSHGVPCTQSCCCCGTVICKQRSIALNANIYGLSGNPLDLIIVAHALVRQQANRCQRRVVRQELQGCSKPQSNAAGAENSTSTSAFLHRRHQPGYIIINEFLQICRTASGFFQRAMGPLHAPLLHSLGAETVCNPGPR
jgi:hypothetical protein